MKKKAFKYFFNNTLNSCKYEKKPQNPTEELTARIDLRSIGYETGNV